TWSPEPNTSRGRKRATSPAIISTASRGRLTLIFSSSPSTRIRSHRGAGASSPAAPPCSTASSRRSPSSAEIWPDSINFSTRRRSSSWPTASLPRSVTGSHRLHADDVVGGPDPPLDPGPRAAARGGGDDPAVVALLVDFVDQRVHRQADGRVPGGQVQPDRRSRRQRHRYPGVAGLQIPG